jgi:signal transduction histidine kinase
MRRPTATGRTVVAVTRRWLFDGALALALTAGSQAEVWTAQLHHSSAAAATTAALTLGLCMRRRWPVLLGTLAVIVLCLHQLVIADVEHASAFTIVALVAALFSLGMYAEPRPALVVGLAGLVALPVIGMVKSHPIGDIVFIAVVLFAPWLAGLELHRRAGRERLLQAHATDLGAQAELRARAAVEEERARIARELHDVVAHAMSVIVVQAGAERHVLSPEQESTRAVLETIERTGRQALGEMRRLLGMMRSTDHELALAPQPSLAYLADLCEQVRAAGLPVDLQVVGQPAAPLPPGVDVSAYRIVQEALTNALKHAGPTQARVRVSYDQAEVDIEINDDGRGAAAAAGAGHGLVGMRERVAVYGGQLHTGNRDAGGYAVHVRLPINGAIG